MVWEMLSYMGLEHLSQDIERQPTRLGPRRHDGRIRALKVEFRNEWAVEQILDQKYALRNPNGNYYNVYINRDMTKTERDAEIADRK